MCSISKLKDYFIQVIGLSEYEAIKATDLFLDKYGYDYDKGGTLCITIPI